MANNNRNIIISGYGLEGSNQPSIALYDRTKQLKPIKELWKETLVAPSFICTHEDMLFTIREGDKDSSILCYQLRGNEYIRRDELLLEGGALCHIVYQPLTKTLYCSFYLTGHIATVRVEDYHFTKVLSFIQIKPDNQEELSRAHCCVLEPNGHRAFVTNIALDRIYIYESENGQLKTNETCEYIQLERGIGPRHLQFHPREKYLYLITEYSNEIHVFSYENEDNKPKLIGLQRISTLPEDFQGESYGSSVVLSTDGRFLYAANRGADTIAVYAIHLDGTLLKIQDASCMGHYPRHINLSKDGKQIMIANQNSNEIVIIGLNNENGKLDKVVSTMPFYKPSYVEEI